MVSGVAQAQDWQPMPVGDLAGLTIRYADAVQSFTARGETFYATGRPSFGHWRETDGRYCSQWPPNTLWICYDLQRAGQAVRFVGEDQVLMQVDQAQGHGLKESTKHAVVGLLHDDAIDELRSHCSKVYASGSFSL